MITSGTTDAHNSPVHPGSRLGVALLMAMAMGVLLIVQPASAAVVVKSSTPGTWSVVDSASQSSLRCYYAWNNADQESQLQKVRIWPPKVKAKAFERVQWRFIIREESEWPLPPSTSTIYTSDWQKQTKLAGGWANTFTKRDWTAPSDVGMDDYYHVWIEVQWRNAFNDGLKGKVLFALEWLREVQDGTPGAIYAMPCPGVNGIA